MLVAEFLLSYLIFLVVTIDTSLQKFALICSNRREMLLTTCVHK